MQTEMQGAPRIAVSDPAPGVRLLRLNRPAKFNALDKAMRVALVDELERAENDGALRVLVIAGSERAFVSGADLAAVADATGESMRNAGLHHVWDKLNAFPKPVVMAVRGYCFGAGCELLMHGDIGIVASDAKIGQPEIKVGIQPGAGGLSRLIALVGYQRAMLLDMTGETISGEQAAAWGLASESVPSDEVESRALAIAAGMGKLPVTRLQSIKKVARASFDSTLTDQLLRERQAYWDAFGTADQREGMDAFLTKREPQFNRD